MNCTRVVDVNSNILGFLEVSSRHVVLDLGCGDGHHSALIDQVGPRQLVDFDIDLQSLYCLKQQSSGLTTKISSPSPHRRSYVGGNALYLPFADHSFDRVVCSLVFYLMPLRQALSELFRVLKPQGRAYLRLPMLGRYRFIDAFHHMPNFRKTIYCVGEVFNGMAFALSGKQIYNPFLRSDHWACYIPLNRFSESVVLAGFEIDNLVISYPRPNIPSIDAWIKKP